MTKQKRDALVGKYFHTFHPVKRRQAERMVEWQGHIEGKLDDGSYLVTIFSWADGSEHTAQIMSLGQMKGWQFYRTADGMNYWYEQYSNRRKYREEQKRQRLESRKLRVVAGTG